LIVKIGKAIAFAMADVFNKDKFIGDACLFGTVLQILYGATIFGGVFAAGEV